MQDCRTATGPPDRSIALIWVAGFVVALALYAATANRGVQWQDSGWQQYRIASATIEHSGGLALTHPLQYFLGRASVTVLPFEPAFCTTLLSSLAASVAIANILTLLTCLVRRRMVAIVCTAALLLSHTLWQLATRTESYTLVLALLSFEWLFLYRYARSNQGKWLLGVALFNGLGIANHMLASLALPVDAVIVCLAVRCKHLSLRWAIAAAAIWAAGTLPYSILILSKAVETGDLAGAVHSALFGDFEQGVLNTSLGMRALLLSLGYIAYNFPGLTIPMAAHACVRRVATPRVFTIALRCQLAIFFLFVVRYAIVDQYTFYIPVYGALTVMAGIGLDDCVGRFKPAFTKVLIALALVTALWPPLIYVGTKRFLASRGALKSLVGNRPYRDGYAEFFTPWGIGKDHAERMNTDAFHLAGPDGVIVVEDSMMRHAVFYHELLNGEADRTDIVLAFPSMSAEEARALHSALLADYAQGRNIVLVPRDRDKPQTLTSCCSWRREGDLYILEAISPACD